MALGTITVNFDEGRSGGPHPMTRLSFPGDTSYPVGGSPDFQDAVRAAFGQDLEVVDIVAGDCGIHKPSYDKANDKLFVRLLSTGAEVGGGTNLSGVTFNVLIIGK